MAVATEPGVQPDRGSEQRGGAGRREDLSGALHCAFLIEVWCGEPLVQVERMAGGVEDGARSMMRSAPSMRRRNPSSTAARCQGSIAWPSTAAWGRTASSPTR